MIKFKKTKGFGPDNIMRQEQDIYIGESACCLYRVYQPYFANPEREWKAQAVAKKHVGGFSAWLLSLGKEGFKSADDAMAELQKHDKISAGLQKVKPDQLLD